MPYSRPQYRTEECSPAELCADAERWDGLPHFLYTGRTTPPDPDPNIAWCVNWDTYSAAIERIYDGYLPQSWEVEQLSFGAIQVVGLMLTSVDSTLLIDATSLQVQAQSVHELFGAKTYNTLSKGLSGCMNCATTAIRTPRGTQRLQIRVAPKTGVEGRLYLVNLSPVSV
ncbi:hypothetical protein MMC20_003701 [Loxospora ochrophaea]|nr:hypothetical protein [Loxospora ochrophaea]